MKSSIVFRTLAATSLSSLCLLAPFSSEAALIDGIVEFWEFDGDYSAGIDETHAGTLQAKGAGLEESGFVTAKFGQGIDLESGDASNQASVVIGGDEDDFNFAGESMSVSLWYTTESLYRNWQTLIGKGENNTWRLARNQTTNQIKLYLTIVGDGKLELQDGSWHHVVATVDATEGNRLYVDGELVASNAGPSALTGNTSALQIGGNPQAADRGWDGILDDVAIWNRALTEDEVASIWNEGDGASIASLIGAGDAPFNITDVEYSVTADEVKLTWDSRPGIFYVIRYSKDLVDWQGDLEDGVSTLDDENPEEVDRITKTFPLAPAQLGGLNRLFFRVEEP